LIVLELLYRSLLVNIMGHGLTQIRTDFSL
jgi:hypothetical protein